MLSTKWCKFNLQTNEDEACADFLLARKITYRTHLFFLDYDYTPAEDGFDVTLVAQLSVDRLQMVESLLLQYNGNFLLKNCDNSTLDSHGSINDLSFVFCFFLY